MIPIRALICIPHYRKSLSPQCPGIFANQSIGAYTNNLLFHFLIHLLYCNLPYCSIALQESDVARWPVVTQLETSPANFQVSDSTVHVDRTTREHDECGLYW